jgi:hypothetical protein
VTAVISRPAVRTAPVFGAGVILVGLLLTWSAPVPPRPVGVRDIVGWTHRTFEQVLLNHFLI